MRLATGATHERDTREKAPVFLRRGLTQEAAPLPLSFERRLISATSFIRNARSRIHKRRGKDLRRVRDRYANFFRGST